MHALILGGNGFIGSYIVDELLAAGNKVRIFGRAPIGSEKPLPLVEYIYGEFSDTAKLSEALNDIDVVYHSISTTVPSSSNKSPVEDVNGNLINTINLLECMRRKSVPRIVYLSSGGTVYGIPDSSPVSESHPLRPISSYGIVKVAVENYLHMFHELHGISYVALRVSNPYGAGQSNTGLQGVIGTYISRLNEGFNIEVWGTGEIVRDFIHVQDVAQLCVLAGKSKAVGVFNAGFGEGTSILNIIDIVSQYLDYDIEVVFKPGRSFDVPHIVLDITKAQTQFHWSPTITLKSGIHHTMDRVFRNSWEKLIAA